LPADLRCSPSAGRMDSASAATAATAAEHKRSLVEQKHRFASMLASARLMWEQVLGWTLDQRLRRNRMWRPGFAAGERKCSLDHFGFAPIRLLASTVAAKAALSVEHQRTNQME
jgi:hypothetical protein